MFNTTFFKFLAIFVLIIGLSSWAIGAFSGLGDQLATSSEIQKDIIK